MEIEKWEITILDYVIWIWKFELKVFPKKFFLIISTFEDTAIL